MKRSQSTVAKIPSDAAEPTERQSRPKRGHVANEESAARVKSNWTKLDQVQLKPDRLEAGRVVAYRSCPESAPFDLMRTNLLHQLRENRWSRVAITSPDPSCGKTTTTLNLAFSIARQRDLRVLVLELDLRRPAMMSVLGVAGQYRFASVLDNKERPHKQMLRWKENLAFGLNSSPYPNSAELLSSARAAAAIDAIEASFQPDVVLFDLPPVLVGDDTIAFLDQVDCALMVAAASQSTSGAIDRCGEELAAHTEVLGVILNKCRYMDKTEGYGHYGDY